MPTCSSLSGVHRTRSTSASGTRFELLASFYSSRAALSASSVDRKPAVFATRSTKGGPKLLTPPSPQDADAITASDIARRVIANETGQSEHEVEKTDTILAGLVVQYLRGTETTDVVVLTDDIPANHGIETAVDELSYGDAIDVYGLSDIIDDDSDDSLTVI